ncbi:unnamed protein product, partial [Hapterophycus canaliculatus]
MPKVASLLLGAYAEVDARDKLHRTPLHLCSETGHQAVVKVLLDFKANMKAVDFRHETPLCKAARSGMVTVFEALVNAGADIEVRDVDTKIAGDAFNSKASLPAVPRESRDKIIAMRNDRQQELAKAKEREEAVRIASRVKAG